jgi:ribosome biogenesis GTPase A
MQKEKKIKEEKRKQKYPRIVLAGNPNVGKSVIFGLLTGKYVTVSNYPGTTVEVSTGNIILGERKFLVVDSPGVNSFMPMSEDERVTRDILLTKSLSASTLSAWSPPREKGYRDSGSRFFPPQCLRYGPITGTL